MPTFITEEEDAHSNAHSQNRLRFALFFLQTWLDCFINAYKCCLFLDHPPHNCADIGHSQLLIRRASFPLAFQE